MMNRTVIALLYLLLCFECLAQERAVKGRPQTLFKVNKRPVTVDEFIYLYKKNHLDTAKDFTAEKINEYLNLFVNFKLKVEEARHRKLDTTKVFLKEYNGYRDELRKPYLPDSKLVDSLVHLTYKRLQEEVKASHILVALKAEASPSDTAKAYDEILALRKRIISGEDFSQVAAQFSDDPSAKSNGGNLGYFTALQMVYPFETAAYITAVGDVSHPVRTKYGYHIVKVTDRRPAKNEVEVSHILLRTGREKDNEKIKNTIFEIYDQLKAGVAWEELCSQFSEDINSKDDGGKLKPFGTGEMSSVPEFERTAFSLEEPGQISDPFQTQYGWHIMRLERILSKPTFESMKTSLKNSVTRDERTSLSKKDLQEKLRRDYKFIENTAVKNNLFALADSSLQAGKWNPSQATIAPKATVFTLADTPFSVESVVAYVKANQRPTKLEPAKQFGQLYNDFIDKKIIELVEAKIMADHPEYKYLLQEYYEGILLFDIMEKEVWTKASQDSVGQRTYYEAHKADYASSERVDARIFSAADSTFRMALQQLIADSAKGAIDNFLSQYKVKEEEGIFEKKEKAVLGIIPWTKGLHSAENNGMYYLAWLKDILPAGPMSFEEVRPGVISDYQTFLEKEWVKQLRKKYRVRMNDKGKRYILQQLVAKK